MPDSKFYLSFIVKYLLSYYETFSYTPYLLFLALVGSMQ